MENYRTLTLSQLLKWAEDNRDIMRLKTDRDLLPGGYMAAFAPALVAWQESELRDTNSLVILRNVNYGGNPLERTTVLQSTRVPLDGIVAAEFVLVPLDRRGRTHHAELRFIFDPDRSPEFLNLAAAQTGTVATFPDLVFSWEAWRPPQLKFDLKAALDEGVYGLTLRAFAGPQLFLEDSFRQRDWFAYRLQLPGGQAGLQELFKVVLALGDGVARNTIARLLNQDEARWLAHAPAGQGESEQEAETWRRLEAKLKNAAPARVDAESLPESEQTYQPLVRSCATLARYAVLLATWRMIDQGHTDGVNLDRLPDAELTRVEGWMKTAAHADLRRVFLSAPAALRFLSRNPQAIPSRIPAQLDAAGLLVRKDSKPWETRYGRKATRPYSASGINLAD
jgi:hypothetical protein